MLICVKKWELRSCTECWKTLRKQRHGACKRQKKEKAAPKYLWKCFHGSQPRAALATAQAVSEDLNQSQHCTHHPSALPPAWNQAEFLFYEPDFTMQLLLELIESFWVVMKTVGIQKNPKKAHPLFPHNSILPLATQWGHRPRILQRQKRQAENCNPLAKTQCTAMPSKY